MAGPEIDDLEPVLFLSIRKRDEAIAGPYFVLDRFFCVPNVGLNLCARSARSYPEPRTPSDTSCATRFQASHSSTLSRSSRPGFLAHQTNEPGYSRGEGAPLLRQLANALDHLIAVYPFLIGVEDD